MTLTILRTPLKLGTPLEVPLMLGAPLKSMVTEPEQYSVYLLALKALLIVPL